MLEHILLLQLRSAWLAVKFFLCVLRHLNVLIHSDNMVTVKYLPAQLAPMVWRMCCPDSAYVQESGIYTQKWCHRFQKTSAWHWWTEVPPSEVGQSADLMAFWIYFHFFC